MIGRLASLLLICRCLQDVGVLAEPPQATFAIDYAVNPSEYHGTGMASGRDQFWTDDDRQLYHKVQNAIAAPDNSMATKKRRRRHIGSVAAFRGLPGPVTKQPTSYPEWSALMDRKLDSIMNAVKIPFEAISTESYDDIGKDKRYPEEILAPPQTNSRDTPDGLPKMHPDQARIQAVNRLLRLMSEAKSNSKVNSFFKTKKFLGALARNNGLPFPIKQVPSQIQYKGSTAIPLPGKKNLYHEPVPKEIVDYERLIAQMQNDSLDGYDDSYGEISEDDDMDMKPTKRHVGSLAKSGWLQRPHPFTRIHSGRTAQLAI